MRGRKPQPTVLRILRGNPGKKAINRADVQTSDLDPACPSELRGDPEAAVEWERTIAPAVAIGVIRSGDRASAIAHCELWATWRSQVAACWGTPHIVTAGRDGYPIPNPIRVLASRTLQQLTKVDAELGLTPTSRSRVSGAKAAVASKVQAFMMAKRTKAV